MFSYLDWHYFHILPRLCTLWVNLTIFPLYFFGVFHHIKTLFVPWKRQGKRTKPGFHVDDLLSVFFFSMSARAIGILMRIAAISVGLISMPFFATGGAFVVCLWILIPFATLPWYIQQQRFLTHNPSFILSQMGTGDDRRSVVNQTLRTLALHISDTAQAQFTSLRLGLSHQQVISKLKDNQDQGELAAFRRYLSAHHKKRIDSSIIEALFGSYMPLLLQLRRIDGNTNDVYEAAFWFEKLQEQKKTPLHLDRARIKNMPCVGIDWAYGYTTQLASFARDITKNPAPYPLLLGRDNEMLGIEKILVKSEGNNVLLVGEPGTARHLLIQTLATRMRSGQCLTELSHKRILEVDMHALVSSQPTIEKVKGFLRQVLSEAAAAGNVIVCIDGIDRYLSHSEGRMDLSDVMENFAQSSVGMIGITTQGEFHRYIQSHESLAALFEKFELSPVNNDVLLTELELAIVPVLERKHKVLVTIPSLSKTIEDANRYITETPFPAKAIELLDQAVVGAVSKKEFVLTAAQIDATISEKLKIPVGSLTHKEKTILVHLEERLHQRIINQHEAIQGIAGSLRRSRLNVSSPTKPIGSFLFLGPTGVGKTETAKALAQLYFGAEQNIVRFDMSQYQKEEGIQRLIGSAKSTTPGELTKGLRDHPFSVVLLDEFEKSDPTVYNLFLTLFDEGYVSDANGKHVDARNTIVIATSNAGSTYLRDRIKEGMVGDTLTAELTNYILSEKLFSPELLNRFDKVVVYTPLSEGHLREVTKLLLGSLNSRLAPKEVSVVVTDNLVRNLAAAGFDPTFGARAIKRAISEKVEDDVAKRLLAGTLHKGEQIVIQ